MNYQIFPSKLQGKACIPPSKSQTMRALLFASLSKGQSIIRNYLKSPDTTSMIEALKLFGVSIDLFPDHMIVQSDGVWKAPSDVIQCGNSGQVLRFVGALSALYPHYTILTGDPSLRFNRPLHPLIDGLTQLGAKAVSSRENGYAPLILQGPLVQRKAMIDGKDSQPVSGLILAAAFAPFPIEIYVNDPGEIPWIDLTLSWLEKFQIPYTQKDHRYYRLEGNAKIEGFDYRVPADWSSASFIMGAALATHSEITIESLDFDDLQGDKTILAELEKRGAHLQIDRKNQRLHIFESDSLDGGALDINPIIDALPIISTLSCFAKAPSHIYNGQIARKKESDRISAMAHELKKMGAQIEEKKDGFLIFPSLLQGAELFAHLDHRIAMALTIAALAAQSPSILKGGEVIEKSFPQFFETLKSLGAEIFMI